MGESAREAAIFLTLALVGLLLLLRSYGDSWKDIIAITGMTALILVTVTGLAWIAEAAG